MSVADSRDVKDEQTIEDPARVAIQTDYAQPDEQIGPGDDPVSLRRHLDVDAVLARSLPRVAGEESSTRPGEQSPKPVFTLGEVIPRTYLSRSGRRRRDRPKYL
jgi:hypothetical protein